MLITKASICRSMASKHGKKTHRVDPLEQKIEPLDRILRGKRAPVLFVGSGVSSRYIDSLTWDELLKK